MSVLISKFGTATSQVKEYEYVLFQNVDKKMTHRPDGTEFLKTIA